MLEKQHVKLPSDIAFLKDILLILTIKMNFIDEITSVFLRPNPSRSGTIFYC
jgi:hypothetical protein